ncbi:copia protein [Tanacetum coccineum]
MIEPEKPLKKKDVISLDEEIASKLQAEFNEEERIIRAEEEKIDEANIAWDDIQAKSASKRAKEKDNKPPTKTQQKKIMITYLKNMEGWKHKDLKSKDFDYIKELEDLEDLYKLVKAKYGSTRPVEDLDLVLWNDLKTMFKPHVEDEIWKLQQRYKVLSWKLFDSCRVHCLSLQSGMIYMLVEKRYPLTPPIITDMLNKKLQGRIVGIKSLLNAASITTALIDVNAAYYNCQYKVNVAEGVNAACEEVSTAELFTLNAGEDPSYVLSGPEDDWNFLSAFMCYVELQLDWPIDRQLPFEYTIASRSTYVIGMVLPDQNINHSAFRSMFKREKLSGSNFNDWFRSLKLVLRVEKKMLSLNNLFPLNLLPIPPLKFLRTRMRSLNPCLRNKLELRGYVEQWERLGYVLPQDLSVGLILKGLTSDFAGSVGHWKRNCPVYLAELKKKKKKVCTTSSSVVMVKNEVENLLGKTIKALRSDRGGEYISQEFKDYLEACGIVQQLIPPYTP